MSISIRENIFVSLFSVHNISLLRHEQMFHETTFRQIHLLSSGPKRVQLQTILKTILNAKHIARRILVLIQLVFSYFLLRVTE